MVARQLRLGHHVAGANGEAQASSQGRRGPEGLGWTTQVAAASGEAPDMRQPNMPANGPSGGGRKLL
uniref:Uncharacterized protein n=1 Tax=Sphaerodactylus townsendi TaxID=933632 RepID=A0ACB8G3U2_9SAUR